MDDFVYLDASLERWTNIHANHKEEARQRALSLIAAGRDVIEGSYQHDITGFH